MTNKSRESVLRVEHLECREMLTANAFEQYAAYLINSVRHDEGLAPYAINGRLMNSAGAKATDLKNCFSNVCGSRGPSDWLDDAGYNAEHGPSELIAQFSPPGTPAGQAVTAVDFWLDHSGTRALLLGDHAEIGVGRAESGNTLYWAAHTATADNQVFLTGVVFDDSNGNGRYDYNEGLPGVTVRVADRAVTSQGGGGWAVAVEPNQPYSITVQGGDFAGMTSGTVDVGSISREVDVISGEDGFRVDFAKAGPGSDGGGDTDGGDGPGGGGGGPDGGGDGNGYDHGGKVPKEAGRVSGRVYLDLDRDRERSSDEQLLSSWIVYVDENRNGKRDANEPAKRTDADGRYEYRLPPGVHHIGVELRPAFDATTHVVRSVSIASGVHKTRKDFGVFRANSVSGTVFLDANQDGSKDPTEAGLPGWTVFVDENENGLREAGERRVVTGADGGYQFASLGRGAGQFVVVPQAGFHFSRSNVRTVTVIDRADVTRRDFGVHLETTANGKPPRAPARNFGSVSGQVFADFNEDGELSKDEMTLAGWRVYIDENDNGQFDSGERSQRTDDEGRYMFSLPLGVYPIGVEMRSEFFEVTTRQIRTVLIEADMVKDGKDFGVLRDNSISGTIYGDFLDGTQRQHTFECLLAPANQPCAGVGDPAILTGSSETWTVFLDDNRNGRRDPGERSTTTDDNGQYEFISLIPRSYQVVVQPKPGYRFDRNERAVAVVDGVHKEGKDFFPVRRTGEVNGRVFRDAPAGRVGVYDVGEAVTRRVVFADLNDNGLRDEGEWWTATNEFGAYQLTLPVGVHRVRVELGPGETASRPARSVDIVDRVLKDGKDFILLP